MVDETTPTPAADGAVPPIPVPPPGDAVGSAAPVEPTTPAVPPVPVAPVAAGAPVVNPVAAPVYGAVPPAGGAPVYGAVPPVGAAPKRKLWPYFLGAGILVVILLVVAVAVLLVNLFTASASPSQVVREFDKSFAQVDCELFKKTTTADFQDSFFSQDFSCKPWEENAKGLQVDGVYAYTVVIGKTTVDGDTAEVVTKETDSTGDAPTDYNLDYHLVKTNGAWLIDSIENLAG